ncbi:hypothetical protein [Sphaerisporangium fuscum]|uniref:hypothetical protein n=1 Tax=Sphaerisporangium fuscum TaxID=2835868 RepID=UPI001BDD0FD7|nr:hypothetical protein [Sphaerisporangium fuscum]
MAKRSVRRALVGVLGAGCLAATLTATTAGPAGALAASTVTPAVAAPVQQAQAAPTPKKCGKGWHYDKRTGKCARNTPSKKRTCGKGWHYDAKKRKCVHGSR